MGPEDSCPFWSTSLSYLFFPFFFFFFFFLVRCFFPCPISAPRRLPLPYSCPIHFKRVRAPFSGVRVGEWTRRALSSTRISPLLRREGRSSGRARRRLAGESERGVDVMIGQSNVGYTSAREGGRREFLSLGGGSQAPVRKLGTDVDGARRGVERAGETIVEGGCIRVRRAASLTTTRSRRIIRARASSAHD